MSKISKGKMSKEKISKGEISKGKISNGKISKMSIIKASSSARWVWPSIVLIKASLLFVWILDVHPLTVQIQYFLFSVDLFYLKIYVSNISRGLSFCDWINEIIRELC